MLDQLEPQVTEFVSTGRRRRRFAQRAIGPVLLTVLAMLLVAAVVLVAVWVTHARPAGAAPAGQPGLNAGVQAPGNLVPLEPSGTGDTSHLTPALHRALVRASAAAAADDVTIKVTSGWRSAAHQQELYDQAIAKYGSAAKARQWVLPPADSEHVQGRAVDIGPHSAATWLEQNGVKYGLCRRYENEPWHFELLAPHKGQACPAMEPHA
jgi:D-alanyl-D-alanine carboxypeptidase